MSSIELIAKIEGSWNEQPVWMPEESSLYWTNRVDRRLYRFNTTTRNVDSWHNDRLILSLCPREKGGFIATLEDGIAFYEPTKGYLEYICKPEPFIDSNCFVGGLVDEKGGYWSASRDRQQQHNSGAIYNLSPTFSTQRFRNSHFVGVTTPVFSLDNKTLYQSGGHDRYIYAFSVAQDGTLDDKRTLCRIPKPEGRPHGITIDSQGNLWVCHLDGRYISVFNASGERLEKIKIAASNVTYCTFGGEDMATLYVVTASQGLTHEAIKKQSQAGCLISLQTGAVGRPQPRFAG